MAETVKTDQSYRGPLFQAEEAVAEMLQQV